MTATETVTAFVAKLELCLLELRTHLQSVDRDSPAGPMVAADSSGSRSRSGRLDGMGSFQLHGVGCRLELDSGEEIDFDWNAEGAATFDGWRLRTFARSLGHTSVTEQQLVDAAREFAAAGTLVEDPQGWFRVSEKEL